MRARHRLTLVVSLAACTGSLWLGCGSTGTPATTFDGGGGTGQAPDGTGSGDEGSGPSVEGSQGSEGTTQGSGGGSTGGVGGGGAAGSQAGAGGTLTAGSAGSAGDGWFAWQPTNQRQFRIVVVVPSGVQPSDDDAAALTRAAEHVQIWFTEKLGDGRAFSLSDPPVLEVQSTHDTAWFSTQNVPGDDPYYDNTRSEAFALTGVNPSDSNYVYVIYNRAQPKCGQGSLSIGNAAVVVANDLNGMTGRPLVATCKGDSTKPLPVCRWVGGLALFAGDLFGLAPPSDCTTAGQKCTSNELVYLGYSMYPSAILTATDKKHLDASPFFLPAARSPTLFDCSSLL